MSDEIRSFKKVEDHIKRILAILDKHTQMIEELENIVQKMGVKVDFTSQESGQALGEIAELKELNKRNWDRILAFEDHCDTWSPPKKCNKLNRKTEKKEDDSELKKRLYDAMSGKSTPYIPLDSGGEKPPEPKDGTTWTTNTTIFPINEPREDVYTCRLCGNEITLVEHEVSKLTVEVKREDLQFLYRYCNDDGIYDGQLQNEFWGELKRIKEEYDIK